jgi:hypothetical protein
MNFLQSLKVCNILQLEYIDELWKVLIKKGDLFNTSYIIIYHSFLLTEKNQKVKTIIKNQKIQRFASLKF